MSNAHYYAVILAGGSGTRFWPVSRKKKPKQFLEIFGKQCLLDLTLKRIKPLIKAANIYIVTNKQYAAQTRQHARKFGVPAKNIMLEPVGRNTAPAICWASAHIHNRDKQAITVVLPSDHVIRKEKEFHRALRKAIALAQDDYLVTFGIVPTRPETGYGYLKTIKAPNGVILVDKFKEKPDLAKAKQFIKSKNYFWNSGMFVWKTAVIMEEFKKSLPHIHCAFHPVPRGKKFAACFAGLEGISIDYGILEKSKRVAAVGADIGWSDVGSWESLMEVFPGVEFGRAINIGSQNTFVYAKDRIVATVGMKDCLIIDTPDALLVCAKDQSQKVKDVVETLKKTKLGDLL